MHSSLLRLCALSSALVMLGACDEKQPLDPTAEASASGATIQAPSNTKVVAASASETDVSWQDNSTNEAGFEVWGAQTGLSLFGLWTTKGPNVTTQSFTGINPRQEYCVKVRALTALGQSGKVRAYSDFSNTACATTPPPAGPSKIAARPLSSTSVEVTWSNDIGFLTSAFRVERSIDQGANWTAVIKTDQFTTRIVDYGRSPEQPQLCYRVIAITQFGESAPSKLACTTPPAAPMNLTATGIDGPAIALAWTDNSAVEDGYQVLRAPDQFSFTVVANLPANSTSYRDAGVSGNTPYWYQVRAKKDSGFSDVSNSARGFAATTPPSPPAVYAYPATSNIITAYWVDTSGLAETFRVERSLDGGLTGAAFGSLVPGQTSLSDDGRTPEQQVCYRVYGANSRGESGPSSPACTAPPLGPTTLVATTVDYQSINLTWTDNSGVENGYDVLRYDCYYDYYSDYYYCDYFIVAELPENTTTFLDAGLASATFYSYYVVAIKDGGTSDYSNEANATTDAGVVAAATKPATGRLHIAAALRGLKPGAPTKRPLPAAVKRQPVRLKRP